MLVGLSKLKKTKLVIISLAFVLCSALCGAGVSKIVNLKVGESLDTDNLKVVCQASTSEIDVTPYKKTRDVLVRFCKQHSTFPSNVEKCLSVNAKYLAPEALEICSNLTWETEKLKCISAISNKVYSDEELKMITSSGFSSTKIELLEKMGATI